MCRRENRRSPGDRASPRSICRAAKAACPLAKCHLTGRGGGSLLASKVGSFLGSAEALVGEKTPGRLMSGGTFKAGHGFILGLPTAVYLTWQGTLLEGNGIEPDETVELSREGLKTGVDTQMQRAIEIVQRL